VNQTLAYQALAMLARLFRYGRLSYHGGFVNLRTGRTTPLPVSPEVWKRMKRGAASSAMLESYRQENISFIILNIREMASLGALGWSQRAQL
jgi:hypothetical protein